MLNIAKWKTQQYFFLLKNKYKLLVDILQSREKHKLESNDLYLHSPGLNIIG